MKASLLHPLSEPRHRRRHRRARHSAPTNEPTPQRMAVAQRAAATASPCCDPDVRRVREAGGPVDRASYACGCGYMFSASVSTTVACPHCGSDQAW
jgi:hypothetical protein